MGHVVRSWLLGLAGLLATGCLEATSSTCADGFVCPSGLACFAGAGSVECVRPELVEACQGVGETQLCTLPGTDTEGTCQNGLCSVRVCGNCQLEGDEVCDDGNQLSGDGCRSDCLAATWDTSRRDLGATAFATPHSLAADQDGTLYVADEHRVSKVNQDGDVTILAGTDNAGDFGDDGPARDAALNLPRGVAVDSTGTLFIGDSRNHRVRTIDDSGIITTMAGDTAAYAEEPSPLFREPSGLFHEASSQTLLIADAGNHVVRLFDIATGSAPTFIGKPEVLGVNLIDANGDEQITADEVRLFLPRAVVRCPSGDWYVADTGNNRVLRIASTGCDPLEPETCVVTTVLGDTEPASSGEGFPSDIFPVHAPQGLHCDSQNNLFISSTTTVRLVTSRDTDGDPATPRVVDGTGNVQSILGDGFSSAEEFPCTSEDGTSGISGIVGIDDDTILVTDSCTGSLIELVRPVPGSSCSE